MFGDSNGQIKLRTKQKIQGSFCYKPQFALLQKMYHREVIPRIVSMCQNMGVEILWRLKSGWKPFPMIKVVLKAKLDKTLHANLFNSIILPLMLYASEMWATMKKEELRDWLQHEEYRNIYAGNIIAWVHQKRDEGCDQSTRRRSVTSQNIDPCSCRIASERPETIIQKTPWQQNEIFNCFGPTRRRRVRLRMKWKDINVEKIRWLGK